MNIYNLRPLAMAKLAAKRASLPTLRMVQRERKAARLQYVGRLLRDMPTSPRMWNLILPGHPSHLSTIGIETLTALGFIKGDK